MEDKEKEIRTQAEAGTQGTGTALPPSQDPVDVDHQIQLLMECMGQNIDHARHVEGERMNFIQMHLVLVGAVLAILADNAFSEKSNLVLLILLALTLLGVLIRKLVIRWDDVFRAHRVCALRCYAQIEQLSGIRKPSKTQFPDVDVRTLDPDKEEGKTHWDLKEDVPNFAFSFAGKGTTGKIIRGFTDGLILVTGAVTLVYLFNFWILPYMQ